jgi:hypothetical protein
MGVFNAMTAAGEVDIVAIAEKTSAYPLLVGCVMRLLAAMCLFRETGQGKYSSGPLVPLYADWSLFSQIVLLM